MKFNLLQKQQNLCIRTKFESEINIMFNKGFESVNINLNKDLGAYKQYFNSKIENSIVTLSHFLEILT